MLGKSEIESRFGFHKATLEGRQATAPQHAALRERFKVIAGYLDTVLPETREKALCMTALEEASMWSHKAIAKSAPLEDTSQTPEERELRERIATEVGRVVTNSYNWPVGIQVPMLGRDLSEPIELITDGIMNMISETNQENK